VRLPLHFLFDDRLRELERRDGDRQERDRVEDMAEAIGHLHRLGGRHHLPQLVA